ncbi:thioredoxin family protein [Mucilaginibacter segetis]|uniref:Thioredoxin family protein n=1 Tax=Mucilaginibacter segetis TaxID=2793071 RepID=A0A934UML9_9SPHI|nr:thioredoxin family protein [Mucilaginibacter segetis]MBK0379165.1 thioredoxin family protein [Mucilaginibacter segetis]
MKKLLLFSLVCLFIVKTNVFAQSPMPGSQEVMQQAYARAAKENKNVMLIFHASWCGWCKKMEASLNDPTCKKMFDDNYVITTLDVMEQPEKKNLENPGSMEMMTKFHGEKSGLSFWVILDAKGNVLADSQVRPAGAPMDTYGDNVGCPASEEEVAYLTKILKTTSKLNDNDLAIISKRFALNKPVPAPKLAAGTN